jgi:hypothetical protein
MTALAPFIPTLAEADASGPKRLLLFTHPQGSNPDRWRSNGGGARFTNGGALPELQGPMLTPLNRHRSGLILLDGLDITSATLPAVGDGGGTPMVAGHSGRSVLWSGARMTRNPALPNDDHTRFFSSAPTIDHIIGEGTGTRFASLVLGTTSWLGRDSYSLWSYRDAADPDTAIVDPQVTFDLLFGMLDADSGVASRRRAERRSVLDMVRGELGRLRGELPSHDRDRLDRHVESVSALERRVAITGGAVCARPDRPRDTGDNDQLTRLRMQSELGIMALACDLTRVVSIALAKEGGTPTWLPGGEDTHLASHESFSGATPEARRASLDIVTLQNRIVADEFATMVDRLQGASIYDNTIAVWGASMGWGGPHTSWNAPFIVASGRSDLRTGRYHRWGTYETGVDNGTEPNVWVPAGGIPHNRLLTSLLHAMERPDVTRVGDAGGGAELDNTPLSELFA